MRPASQSWRLRARFTAAMARSAETEPTGLLRPASFGALWLGIGLGLGLGVVTCFGIGGLLGAGVCLLVLGPVCWLAKDAEPVLVQALVHRQPEEARNVAEDPLMEEAGTEPALTIEVAPAHVQWPAQPAVVPVTEPVLPEPLEMVALSGGTFLMGSPAEDREAYDNEKPQHTVTVSAFWMSRYPITRQLYLEITGQSPAAWAREANNARLPANDVSWFDAVAFCNALSTQVGLQPCYHIEGQQVTWDSRANGYRLPTEAEWEYACRAGTISRWLCGDDEEALERYAWFDANSGGQVHPVGEKEANLLGLHDMIGNVLEWCWDWYTLYQPGGATDPQGALTGSHRVLRGGSPWLVARRLRSANRAWAEPVNRNDVIGFRCVRARAASLDPSSPGPICL